MTKRYMDFAPKKKSSKVARVTSTKPTVEKPAVRVTATKTMVRKPVARVTTVKRPVAKPAGQATVTRSTARPAGVAKPVTTRATVTRKPVARVIRSTGTSVPAKPVQRKVKLGEIEDVNPKFVMTDVPKRALGGTAPTATDAKAQKVGARAPKRTGDSKRKEVTNERKNAYTVPRSPFINQDKVAKRPLSGNIYRRQIDEKLGKDAKKTGAKSDKTVTIISKPEKDSKVGVIVTIVLTIILGAVAGTVAFLLLPK